MQEREMDNNIVMSLSDWSNLYAEKRTDYGIAVNQDEAVLHKATGLDLYVALVHLSFVWNHMKENASS